MRFQVATSLSWGWGESTVHLATVTKTEVREGLPFFTHLIDFLLLVPGCLAFRTREKKLRSAAPSSVCPVTPR